MKQYPDRSKQERRNASPVLLLLFFCLFFLLLPFAGTPGRKAALQIGERIMGPVRLRTVLPARGGWREEPDPTYRLLLKQKEGENTEIKREEKYGEREENSPSERRHPLFLDYDSVMGQYYTVHPTAAAGRDLIWPEKFMQCDFHLEKRKGAEREEEPQILLYHTHSQEEYLDFHRGNREATVVGAGDYLTELLEEKGYRVYHDRSVYDLENGQVERNRAYKRALEGVTEILSEHPSICVILDLHRDGVPEGTRLVTEDGAAQVMFFNGTSRTPEGEIAELPNPYVRENLAFSFQLKMEAENRFPGFARKIYLKGLRYNLHLRPRSVLIEAGAQTSTYEEALRAMELLAEILDGVLGEKPGKEADSFAENLAQ